LFLRQLRVDLTTRPISDTADSGAFEGVVY
jgi:hypothetical protein